jgi:hypothetical protein
MSFEYVVRPFQSRDVFGRGVLPATPGTSERATLTWGAKVAPNSIPKAKSLGVNVECCNEVSTQSGNEASTVDIAIQGPDANGSTISVRRSDVVIAKKKEDNNCDDWLSNNSYASSGVKEAFSELSSLIHASDSAFMPSGSSAQCKQRTTFKYDGAA